jgi:hypothetical protein
MEKFRLVAGIGGDLIPFRGAPEVLTEVMTERVDAYCALLSGSRLLSNSFAQKADAAQRQMCAGGRLIILADSRITFIRAQSEWSI